MKTLDNFTNRELLGQICKNIGKKLMLLPGAKQIHKFWKSHPGFRLLIYVSVFLFLFGWFLFECFFPWWDGVVRFLNHVIWG